MNDDLAVKGIRTEISNVLDPTYFMIPVPLTCVAVVGVRQEISISTDSLEGFQDDFLAISVIGAEPFRVSLRPKRNVLHVNGGIGDSLLGGFRGGNKLRLLFVRAIDVVIDPLVLGASGGGGVVGELDLRNALNGGVQVLESTISVGIDELVRWLDGVVSGAGSSEVVRSGD